MNRPLQTRRGPFPRPRAVASRTRVVLAVLIVVVLVLVAVAIPRVRALEQTLSGFWVGEPAFLQEAGLSEMYLYIAPTEGSTLSTPRRQGYLVMSDTQGHLVSNQGIEINYAGRWGLWSWLRRGASALGAHFGGSSRPYNFEAALTYDDSAVMPDQMKVGLCAAEGTLALHSNGKLYAFLIRDNETSGSANKNYGAGGGSPAAQQASRDTDAVPIGGTQSGV